MFNRNRIRAIRAKIEDALKELATEEQISVTLGSARFSDNNVTIKLELSTVNADGSANTKEADAFKQLAEQYGFSPGALGAMFEFGGETYTITGCKPRSRKYPIVAIRTTDGKPYKFGAAIVRARIEDQSLLHGVTK